VVKAYPAGVVSSYLHSLKVGDDIEVKGPFVKMPYRANMKKRIGMVAGGTGITPVSQPHTHAHTQTLTHALTHAHTHSHTHTHTQMLQVAKEILKNPQDKTEVHLVFANSSEKDILLKEELDALAAKHKNFKVSQHTHTQTHIHEIHTLTHILLPPSLPPMSRSPTSSPSPPPPGKD